MVLLDDRPEEEDPTLLSSTPEFVERLWETAILDRLGEEFVLRESASSVGSATDGHQSLRRSSSALPLEQEEKGLASKSDGDSCEHCRSEAFESCLLRGKIPGARRLRPTSFCGGEVRVGTPGKTMSCRCKSRVKVDGVTPLTLALVVDSFLGLSLLSF